MSDKLETLDSLFGVKLQCLYDAEKQLVKALPHMATKATDRRLRTSLEKHLHETEAQITRLEQVAFNLNIDLNGLGSKAMTGLLDEGRHLMSLHASDEVMDAAIISVTQGIEHYEIAQYGTVVYFAKRLSYEPEAELLAATLAEEKNTNDVLNQLAIDSVDEKAML